MSPDSGGALSALRPGAPWHAGDPEAARAPDRPAAERSPARPRTRVALVVGGLGLGGLEKQVCQLARGLASSDYEPVVVSLMTGGEREMDLRGNGIELHALVRRRSFDLARLARLSSIFRQIRPAIVHGFDWAGTSYGTVAAAVIGVPVIGSVRVEFRPPRKVVWMSRLSRWRVAAVISNSEAGKRAWAARILYPEDRIVVIPNGFDFADMDRVPPGLRSLRESLSLPSEAPIIGCVGAVYDLKNPHMFLDVAAAVLVEHPSAHFVWVGDGPMRAEIEQALLRRGLAGHVHFVGRRSDAPWLSADFRVGLLTSRTEGLPNAVMEYMYWRRPVVTTNAGGCSELVEHGRTGFLVDCDDAAAMARHVLKLLADPGAAHAMGVRGRQRLEAEYSSLAMVGRTIGVYQEVLRRHPKGPRVVVDGVGRADA